MKISKSSWHFKFLDRYTVAGVDYRHVDYRHFSLCSYVWTLVFFLAIYATAAGLVLFFAGFVIQQIILSPLAALIFFVALIGGVGLAVGFMYLLWMALDYGNRHDGILPAYLKARKDKICPLIEFEEV